MRISRITLLLIAAFTLNTPAMAADAVATVNGKPIKQSLFDFIVKDATDHGQKVDDNVRDVIVSKLISSELVIQEAQKSGIDKINYHTPNSPAMSGFFMTTKKGKSLAFCYCDAKYIRIQYNLYAQATKHLNY